MGRVCLYLSLLNLKQNHAFETQIWYDMLPSEHKLTGGGIKTQLKQMRNWFFMIMTIDLFTQKRHWNTDAHLGIYKIKSCSKRYKGFINNGANT